MWAFRAPSNQLGPIPSHRFMNKPPEPAVVCVLLLLLSLALGPAVVAGAHAPGHAANTSGNASGNGTATGNATGGNISWNASTGNVTGGSGSGGGGFLSGVIGDLGKSVAQGVTIALEATLVDQGIIIADSLADSILAAAVYTPHPENAGNWFHNPTKGAWGGAWEWHQEWGRPLWGVLVLLGGGLGVAFRGLGILSPPEFNEWSKRWLIGLFLGNWSWELGSLYLYFLAGLKSGILAGVTGAGGGLVTDAISSGLVWVFVALLIWINILALVVAAIIIGIVIVVTVVLTPFLGAMLAARAIPLGAIYGPAEKGVRAWTVLPLATLPSALFLAGGIQIATAPFNGLPGTADLVRPVALIGGPALAAVVPIAVYRSASPRGLSIGFAGAGAAGAVGGGLAVRERMKHVKEKAQTGVRGARDLGRGARGAAPVSDGGRAYRAASAPRRAGSRVARLRGGGGEERDIRRLVEDKSDREYDIATLSDRRNG